MASGAADQKAILEEQRLSDLRAIKAKYPKDLVKRIRACRSNNRIDWADVIYDKTANITRQKLTDMNLYRIFDALFIGESIRDFHCDTSKQAIVDEQGNIVDKVWSARDLFEAIQVCDLQAGNNGLTAERIVRCLRQWALRNKYNDISERVREKLLTFEWDGRTRLESYLIETLGLEDSADNRLFSKYWCLSLYNRVMVPGCLAPIAMAMFGAMDAGKSHFQRMICRELLFDKDSSPVTFDLGKNNKDLFRDIYGISIIATIPEMNGFDRTDMRRIKAVMTDTIDTFDQKFGFSGRWPRQFIFMLDGNSYEGLYRDEDDKNIDGDIQGERRWFPVFVGQIPGATGNVRWREDFRVDFGPVFSERLWQMMIECREWFAEHGQGAYVDFVHETTAMVRRFSRDEKRAGRGTIKDETFDGQLPIAVYRAVKLSGYIGDARIGGEHVRGLCVRNSDIAMAYTALFRSTVTANRISRRMKQLPGVSVGRAGSKNENLSTFIIDLPGIADMAGARTSADEFCARLLEDFLGHGTPPDAWMTDSEKARALSGDSGSFAT